jgi:hypothetical protein
MRLVPAIAVLAMTARALLARAEAGDAVLAVSGQARASFAAWADSGSALLPPGPAYSADIAGELRADTPPESSPGSRDSSRLAFEGAVSIDPVAGRSSFTLRELWAEWRPLPELSLRAGRQRLGFGSGYGWNPSNDLDPPRSPADPAAPRAGADAFQLRLDGGGGSGPPLSIALEAIPPRYAPGVELRDARLAGQLYSLIGEVELMATASAARIGEARFPWLLGGWATAPLGPLVIGVEASARRRDGLYRPSPDGSPVGDSRILGACAATATLRLGDFVAVCEAYLDQAGYSRGELAAALASPPSTRAFWAPSLAAPGSTGALHFLGRLSWGSGSLSASCGAIVDPGTGSFSASAEFGATTGDRASVRLRASAPSGIALGDLRRARDDDELGLLGRSWSGGATVSISY